MCRLCLRVSKADNWEGYGKGILRLRHRNIHNNSMGMNELLVASVNYTQQKNSEALVVVYYL